MVSCLHGPSSVNAVMSGAKPTNLCTISIPHHQHTVGLFEDCAVNGELALLEPMLPLEIIHWPAKGRYKGAR